MMSYIGLNKLFKKSINIYSNNLHFVLTILETGVTFAQNFKMFKNIKLQMGNIILIEVKNLW